ncbi:heavy-metal-associated domain-containing protein [Castellaniella sp. FW104-16D08]|uniref:heavy-metal-associated domain-containing protein n=1 Tax=unclassified Castellaniella TaxID=2617606 RepID=UPI003315BE73
MKTELIVSDMTCNHCVQTITQAVQAIAPDAKVQADLPTHRVTVESASVQGDAVLAAVLDADYDARLA